LQLSLQAASPETFGYILVRVPKTNSLVVYIVMYCVFTWNSVHKI